MKGELATKNNKDTIYLLFLVFIPVLIIYFLPFALNPSISCGDQPHYLIVASAIAEKHTLILNDTYNSVEKGGLQAGKIFKGAQFDHHTMIVDPNFFPHKDLAIWHAYADPEARKRYHWEIPPPAPPNYLEYSCRATGWPIIIAAFSKIFSINVEITSLLLSHFAGIGMAIIISMYLVRSGCSMFAAVVSGIVSLIGSSYFIFDNTAFADSMLGLCVAWSIYSLRYKMPIYLGILLSSGVWLKNQFIFIAIGLFILSLLYFNKKDILKLIISATPLVVAYVITNWLTIGHPGPPSVAFPAVANPLEVLHFVFISPQTSILIRNPWTLAVLGLIIPLIKNTDIKNIKYKKPSMLLIYSSLIIIFPILFFAGIMEEGYDYPCRQLHPLLIALAIIFGFIIEKCNPISLIISLFLATISIILNTLASVANPNLVHHHNWYWMMAFINHFN